jgi:hypothetical protein
MLKLARLFIATALLIPIYADAQYYEPIDGQYYSTPSPSYQYQPTFPLIPQYHNHPRSVGDFMDNEIFMNEIAMRANVISASRARIARMTPSQLVAERLNWQINECATDRFMLGYLTLGLYGLYSLAFNDSCEKIHSQPVALQPATQNSGRAFLSYGSAELEKENADIMKKVKLFDDLAAFIHSTGMTQQEFTHWLEAMRVSREDPTRAESIVKSILQGVHRE